MVESWASMISHFLSKEVLSMTTKTTKNTTNNVRQVLQNTMNVQQAKQQRIASKVKVANSRFFSAAPPMNATQSQPPKGKNLPKDVGLHHVLIRDLILALMTNKLIPYDNNRGGFGIGKSKVDPKKINRIADNFRIDSIGEITIYPSDGTNSPIMCDFHNRAQAILKRYFDGRATEDELNEKISLRVVQDHIQTYADLGSCSPSGARERIECRDLCFGAILENQLYPILSEKAETTIRNTRAFLTPISTCLYALGHMDASDPIQWEFTNVYGCRSVSVTWQGLPAAVGFQCLDTDVAKMASVIEEFIEFVDRYHETEGPGVAKQIDQFTHNATFFFFYLFDKLSGQSKIKTPKVLANRVVNNMMILGPELQNLLHGKKVQQKANLISMYKLLGF